MPLEALCEEQLPGGPGWQGLQTRPVQAITGVAGLPADGPRFTLAAGEGTWNPPSTLPSGLRFLTVEGVPELFRFPADMQPVPAEVNRLNDQVLVRYYDREWRDISR